MTEFYVLTLPLKVEKWQADILDKRYELLRQIYNMVQQKLLRQYIYFSQQKAYRTCENFQQKRDFFASHPFHFKGINAKNGEPFDIKFPYTYDSRNIDTGKRPSNGISDYVSKLWSHRVGQDKTLSNLGINSYILEELGLHIMRAWGKRLYDPKSSHVSFKKYGDVNSFGSRYKKNKRSNRVTLPGFNINIEEGFIAYNANGRQGRFADLIKLPIDFSREKKGYAAEALKGGIDSIRKLIIVRRYIRGKNKYYLQLTIEGEKPQKGRTLGIGNVGIDIGPSTIATSSLQGVRFEKLADKCDNIEHELYLINRKLDRSRKANNPQNYNEDGTIKRGVRLFWKKDKDVKRYATLKQVRKDLYRKQAEIRKQQHLIMANALLSQGDTFIVENNPIDAWARRAKETTKTKKGKNRCKKRYGKSIANHAPAMFVSILKNKVLSLGGQFHEVDTRYAATQFDFTNGVKTKHEVSERRILLSNGRSHQRDMLSAFNLQHIRLDTIGTEEKEYNIEQMKADYPIFCKLEAAEQERFMGMWQNEREAQYFVGEFVKHLRHQPQEETVVNRHNGGVGRKHCNMSEYRYRENAKITGSGLVRESIERVSLESDENHPIVPHPIILDGL
ncbi:MAG: hypothetical protein J6M19_01825 [Bacteroidaceae bacterium]|nr:hypothetical protein [Bacteroidaceae bacterium]